MLKEFEYNTKQIVYSVIVPVYNQETIIVKNLESIINYMGDTFEIIIIIYYCQDKTKENIFYCVNEYLLVLTFQLFYNMSNL